MAFARTGVVVDVIGAEVAARQLQSVAAAEAGIATAAVPASAGLDKVNANLGRIGSGAEDMGKKTSLAAQAMSALRKAAELIPGVELGTIFAAAATGVALLASKLFGAADAAGELAKSSRVLTQQLVADAMKVNSIADGMDRYAKSVGAASGKALTFRQEQEALRKIASGEIVTSEGSRKKSEDTEATLRRYTELLENARRDYVSYASDVVAAGGMVAIEAKVKELEARRAEADRVEMVLTGQTASGDPWLNQIKNFGAGLVTRARIAGQVTADQLRRDVDTYGIILDSKFELARRKQEEAERKAKEAARRKGPAADIFNTLLTLPGVGSFSPAQEATAAWERGIANARAQQTSAADLELVMFQRNQMMVAHATPAANDDTERQRERFDELARMYDEAERRTRQFFEMQQTLVEEGKNMLLGFGQAFANAAAAAILNGGGFRKMTNELLKGLAAQALGRSLFEAASAVASLAMGNVPAAVLHGKAAAMFGAIAAGGIIGAAGTGGVGSSSSSGGSGSYAPASGAGTNHNRPGGQSQPTIIVQIGSETVARVVDGEDRRRQMRGGLEVRAA